MILHFEFFLLLCIRSMLGLLTQPQPQEEQEQS